jgi:diguanylate cyclase (GGDEF)-like protein/PAS domain S-box-containing protein
MTLRVRTLLITFTTLASLLVVVFLTSRSLLLGRFVEIERREVRQNVERGLSAVSDALLDLSDRARDYGAWTLSYDFMKTRDPTFVATNLPSASVTSLNIHFFALIDLSGDLAAGRSLDLEQKVNNPLAEGIVKALLAYPAFRPRPEDTQGVSGVLPLQEGLALVSSWPILTTDGSGPARGVLVMGRLLTNREIERIAQRTHLALRLRPLDDPALAGIQTLLLQEPVLVRPLSSESVNGYGLLRDPLGAPSALLEVRMPREVYAQARVSLTYLVLTLLGVGLLFGALNLGLLEGSVLSRISRLSRRVGEIGAHPDLPGRLVISGADELTSLAGAVNRMLETLQDSRTKLKDILEHSSNLFFSHAPDHTFTYVSPQTRSFFDCEPEEALVKWTDFTTDHPTNTEGLAQTNKAIETGQPLEPHELELLTRRGRRIWVEVREVPVVREGRTVAVVGAYTDITERKRAEKLQAAVYWVAHITGSLGDMKDFYQAIQEIVAGLLDVENFSIALTDSERGVLETAYLVAPAGPAENLQVQRLENKVFKTAEPLLSSWETPTKPPVRRDWLGVPLLRGTTSFGVLSVWSDAGNLNLADAEKILVFVSQHVATAIEHKQAQEQIKTLAYKDSLTSLPNRVLFHDRLTVAVARAHREDERVGVLFLDLDHFKVINDSLGHRVGDSLLQAVARRLLASGREGDTVSRLGGDEFTMLLPGITQAVDVAKVADKVLNTIRQPFHIEGHELFLTASIGISLYPEDGEDTETLLKNADASMYRAKEQGRDNYQLCSSAMNATALERLNLENRLRRAITQDEFLVYYQPVVKVCTGEVSSFEALLRWPDAQRGLLRPADFIPLAEVTGLIIPIGPWILRKACLQAREWARLGFPIRVAVNLSARHLQQPGFLAEVRTILDETGLDPRLLGIEITESNAMQNAETTVPALRQLKDLGIGISIDDFGTGYSSLSYLRKLPIDTIKIDQAFVRNLTTDRDEAAIVTAVIAMAHTLKLTVVAEGVETQGQVAFLKEHGCDYGQGYLFGPPAPAEECKRFLTKRETDASQPDAPTGQPS